MLRDQLKDALTGAMKAKDKLAVSTIRLILAAIKDRDIAGRGKNGGDGIGDDEIMEVLVTMVRQRRESSETYRGAGRDELAEQEEGEIEVIERFLPKQLSPEETAVAIDAVIGEIGASSIKDMGRTMAALRERYAGQMDFGRAGALAKERLG